MNHEKQRYTKIDHPTCQPLTGSSGGGQDDNRQRKLDLPADNRQLSLDLPGKEQKRPQGRGR